VRSTAIWSASGEKRAIVRTAIKPRLNQPSGRQSSSRISRPVRSTSSRRLGTRSATGNARGTESLRTPRWREMDSNSRSPVSGDTPQRPLIASPGIISRNLGLRFAPKASTPFAEIPRDFARCRHKGLGLNRTHDDLVGHLRRSGSPLFCRRETSCRLLARAFSEMQAPRGLGGVERGPLRGTGDIPGAQFAFCSPRPHRCP
jgi:hypothetical protein